jgi:predicted TIM-barrel fold metal-dependent hydrolase
MVTRREILRTMALGPVSAVVAGCGTHYPKPLIGPDVDRQGPPEAILTPLRRQSRSAATAVIDVHAHFFNASDVPVRGFISDCLGHNAPLFVRPLIKEMAALADRLSTSAPTAFEELQQLKGLVNDNRGRSTRDTQSRVDGWFRDERAAAADRVVDVVRGSGFEKKYREMVPSRDRAAGISTNEVTQVVSEAKQPPPRDRSASEQDERASAARSKLEFLFYMLSARASTLRSYIDALADEGNPAGIDTVLGCLVDFDYWLERPPRSAHDDQVALHDYLASLHGGFLRPVVAYNPWTDIAQSGAATKRVLRAWQTGHFVAVKIYPPTGFMPAANASTTVKTKKHRPNLTALDAALASFFTTCADNGIPVIAHTAHSNGRDDAHDEFSGPAAWNALLKQVAADTKTPVISFGHFGGDNASTPWTQGFAKLMQDYSKLDLFADISYWDTLMCGSAAECEPARKRLKDALAVKISASESVADRVMFGTDWFMSSQIKNWQTYPSQVRAALEALAGTGVSGQILATNAMRCFPRLAADTPP